MGLQNLSVLLSWAGVWFAPAFRRNYAVRKETEEKAIKGQKEIIPDPSRTYVYEMESFLRSMDNKDLWDLWHYCIKPIEINP